MLQTINSSTYPAFPGPYVNPQPEIWGGNTRPNRGQISTRSSDLEISDLEMEPRVKSSDTLGWQNIRVTHLRPNLSEVVIPVSDAHCLVLNLSTPLQVN